MDGRRLTNANLYALTPTLLDKGYIVIQQYMWWDTYYD